MSFHHTGPNVCEHGQLERQCEICDLRAQVASLTAERDRLREELTDWAAIAANAKGGRCSACDPVGASGDDASPLPGVVADLLAQVAVLTARADAFQVMYTETVDVLAYLRPEHQRAVELLREVLEMYDGEGYVVDKPARAIRSFLKGSGG